VIEIITTERKVEAKAEMPKTEEMSKSEEEVPKVFGAEIIQTDS